MADLDSNDSGWSDSREALLGLNTASVDTDGDGIDNDWEIKYGFNPHDALEAGWDLDLDGYTTLEEHVANTDPTSGMDYLDFGSMFDETNIYLFVDGKVGRSYTLLRTTNLVSGMKVIPWGRWLVICRWN